jgi:septal ring factor EnvC (AmiA/AmiB activator)
MHSERATAGWPVLDYTAVMNALQYYQTQIGHYDRQIRQWEKTTRHYRQQIQHWDAQLNKLRHLDFGLTSASHEFHKVDRFFGANVECPGAVASYDLKGVLDTAISEVLGDGVDGQVLKEQRRICILIVEAKNQKYNHTVDYLNFLKEKTKELEKAQGELIPKIGESPGNTSSYLAQMAEFTATLEAPRAEWESNLRQSDAHIDMLLTIQANLSRRAMHGAPSALGTLVNATALEAAFR